MSLITIRSDHGTVHHVCDTCGEELVRNLRWSSAARAVEQLRALRPELAAELAAVSLPALAELLAVAEATTREESSPCPSP